MNYAQEQYEAHLIRAFNAVDKAWEHIEDFTIDELCAHIDGLTSVVNGEMDSIEMIKSTHLESSDHLALM